jgi:hypothetical protein
MEKIVSTTQGRSHEEVANMIVGNYLTFLHGKGELVTWLIEGETGIGKTALTRLIAKNIHRKVRDSKILSKKYKILADKEMPYRLIDGASADVADFSIPVVNHEGGHVEFYGNKSLGLHECVPCMINIDEMLKMPPPVKAATHTALTPHNRMLGNIPLHALTLVILTGNLTEERLGDTIQGHTANRIVRVRLRKPTPDEYIHYAVSQDYNPYVIGYCAKTPSLFDSFTDPDYDAKENNKIWNPKNGGAQQCFTMRSGESLSHLVYAWLGFTDDDGNHVAGMLSDAEAMSAMQGAVGNDVAQDFRAFVKYNQHLPSPDSIKSDWQTAKTTDDPIAHCIIVTQALGWCKTTDDINAFMNYCTRLTNKKGDVNHEAVNMFVSRGKDIFKNTIFDAEKFRDWCLDKSYINSKHTPSV